MTNEEVIEKLKYCKSVHNGSFGPALKIAIKALEREPCEDAISRHAAVNACLNGWNKDYREIVADLRTLPPVTPQPKTGHWILTIEDWNKWTCSECKYTKRTDVHVRLGYDYCPKCGAKMEVEE